MFFVFNVVIVVQFIPCTSVMFVLTMRTMFVKKRLTVSGDLKHQQAAHRT